MIRTAAFTIGTSSTVVAFDTVSRDPAGLWVPAEQGFVLTETGIYLFSLSLVVVPLATPPSGQFFAGQILLDGVIAAQQQVHQSMPYGFGVLISTTVYVTAGQIVNGAGVVANGPVNGQAGPADTWMAVDYLGTG
jgi:hypothetical protein